MELGKGQGQEQEKEHGKEQGKEQGQEQGKEHGTEQGQEQAKSRARRSKAGSKAFPTGRFNRQDKEHGKEELLQHSLGCVAYSTANQCHCWTRQQW